MVFMLALGIPLILWAVFLVGAMKYDWSEPIIQIVATIFGAMIAIFAPLFASDAVDSADTGPYKVVESYSLVKYEDGSYVRSIYLPGEHKFSFQVDYGEKTVTETVNAEGFRLAIVEGKTPVLQKVQNYTGDFWIVPWTVYGTHEDQLVINGEDIVEK